MSILIDNKKKAFLFHPQRVVLVGCGGIGSNLWDLIAHQTYYDAKLEMQGYDRSYVEEFLLVDADSVETKNLFRQSFFDNHVGMGKAEALADKYSRQLADVGVKVEHNRIWLNEDADSWLREGDMVLLGVDNNASRKILNDIISPKRRGLFQNIIAVNGGNSDELVTVQLMIKEHGAVTTSSFEHQHPEITKPDDDHPTHAECTTSQGMGEDPQLYRANQHAADIMFNIFCNACQEAEVDYSMIWSNLKNMDYRKDPIPEKEEVFE